jgi:single-strand DNA-binding protein
MAFSLNKVMLIGNLGGDAETRFVNDNFSVTEFNLATTRSYKKNDEWVNETTWHKIVAYNLSDFYKEGLKKGKKFYVEGRLQKRDYEDKNGIKRYVTEIIAETLIPLDARDSGFSAQTPSEPGASNVAPEALPDNNDDDLPF